MNSPSLVVEGVAIVDDRQDDSEFNGSALISESTAEDHLCPRRGVVLRQGTDIKAASAHSLSAEVMPLSDVRPQSLVWLWGNVLAQGKVSLLTGAAGMGKSFVALDMAASITAPASRPCTFHPEGPQAAAPVSDDAQDMTGIVNDANEPSPRQIGRDERLDAAADELIEHVLVDEAVPASDRSGRPGDVLLICPEQDLADVVRQRLLAANADLTRIHAVRGLARPDGRLFPLEDDLEILEPELEKRSTGENRIRLVVVDPFPVELFCDRTAVSRVRALIRHLSEIAVRAEAAILLVAESDSSSRGPFTRIEKALESSVQSVWTIVPNLDRNEERLLLSVKTNWTDDKRGHAFYLRQGTVNWRAGPTPITAEQYLLDTRSRSQDLTWEAEWSELGRAREFLQRVLAGGIKKPLYEVRQMSSANDIAFSTLRRAFCGLRGKSERIGLSRWWTWSLPEADSTAAPLPDQFRWPIPKALKPQFKPPDGEK